MSPTRGPFAVIIRRTPGGAWWVVTALYQSTRGRGIARNVCGRHRYRRNAVECVRAVMR